jgi:hypothetical protein
MDPVTMVTVKLRHVHQDIDRHGNVRTYFRRKGGPKTRIRQHIGSQAFLEVYHRLAMFAWAVDEELVAWNPARDVRLTKTASAGFHAWEVAEVEQFEQCHPVGTKDRRCHVLAGEAKGRTKVSQFRAQERKVRGKAASYAKKSKGVRACWITRSTAPSLWDQWLSARWETQTSRVIAGFSNYQFPTDLRQQQCARKINSNLLMSEAPAKQDGQRAEQTGNRQPNAAAARDSQRPLDDRSR